MIKDRMRELELREDFAAPQSSCTSIDQQSLFPDAAANTATTSNGDSTTELLIKASPSRSPGNSDESHQEHGSSVSRRPHGIERKYSRSHQRRFHRRFPTVAADEMLIDWFNCALIADILLQGYLYISDNHFAFYSNIFGYKTQFLIPIANVVSVTKEKTAKIFPNAVGICTDEAKYVFGSLISRESAYRLLQDVWRSTLYQVLNFPLYTQWWDTSLACTFLEPRLSKTFVPHIFLLFVVILFLTPLICFFFTERSPLTPVTTA